MKTFSRRTFLKLPVAVLSFTFFPVFAQALEYKRHYLFRGEITSNYPGKNKKIEGKIDMEIKEGEYSAKLDVKFKGENEILFGMYSKGFFDDGNKILLKPRLSRMRRDFRFANGRNDGTTLIYTYDEDSTIISATTDFYDDNGKIVKTNRKPRTHKRINGLDYLSAVFQIVLSNKTESSISEMDLISLTGKLERKKISKNTNGESDEFSFAGRMGVF